MWKNSIPECRRDVAPRFNLCLWSEFCQQPRGSRVSISAENSLWTIQKKKKNLGTQQTTQKRGPLRTQKCGGRDFRENTLVRVEFRRSQHVSRTMSSSCLSLSCSMRICTHPVYVCTYIQWTPSQDQLREVLSPCLSLVCQWSCYWSWKKGAASIDSLGSHDAIASSTKDG